MNRFDDTFIFRLATPDDIDAIMVFFDENWAKNHILSTSKELFEYEFRDGERVNFALAIDKQRGTIEALWGFYIYNEIPGKKDIGGGPWFVSNRKENPPFLGTELLKRASEMLRLRCRIGVGDNPDTSYVYHTRIEKIPTGVLKHYIIPGDTGTHRIGVFPEKLDIRPEPSKEYKAEYIELHSPEEFRAFINLENYSDLVPYKDERYFIKKYFHHIKNHYHVIGIKIGDNKKTIIVSREQEYNNAKILRIIDCLGDREGIRFTGDYFSGLKSKYEYVDFYNYGLPEEFLKDAGFINLAEYPDIVCPDFFNPYVLENRRIYYSTTIANCIICKGDGDQDRPNCL